MTSEFLADPFCCLKGLGSVNTPSCKIMEDKRAIMSKLEKSVGATANRGYSCAGKSIRDLVWEQLDSVMDRLMEDKETHGEVSEADKGEALGLAHALAIFQNPYQPNIQGVRAESVERWKDRNYDEDDPRTH